MSKPNQRHEKFGQELTYFVGVWVVNVGEHKTEFTNRDDAYDYLEKMFEKSKYSNLYIEPKYVCHARWESYLKENEK